MDTVETPGDDQVRRNETILSRAKNAYLASNDWSQFFNAVFGQDGIVDQECPHEHMRRDFETSSQFAKIQEYIQKLRDKSKSKAADAEAEKVITVRLPKSMHESLKREAHRHQTSLNQLCITKLLRPAD